MSFGPQMRASQVKKSDSEIGPLGHFFHFDLMRCDTSWVQFVSSSCSTSASPGKWTWRCYVQLTCCEHPVRWAWRPRFRKFVGSSRAWGTLPPAVNCLYSVMSLRRAVWLLVVDLEDDIVVSRPSSCVVIVDVDDCRCQTYCDRNYHNWTRRYKIINSACITELAAKYLRHANLSQFFLISLKESGFCTRSERNLPCSTSSKWSSSTDI